MDRREREALDRWLTTDPREVNMSDKLEEWGMDFLDEVEGELHRDHEEDGLWEAWQNGDYDTIFDWIVDEYPDLTSDQKEWIQTALE